MERRTITLIRGDGIGPEVTGAAALVLKSVGVDFDWEICDAGMMALGKYGTPLPNETLESIQENQVALKGPLDTPIGAGYDSINVRLRKEFKLYANIRPIKSMPGVKSHYENVDLVVFREGIEGVYGGTEKYLRRHVRRDDEIVGAEIKGAISTANCHKFFEKVFKYAKEHGRKRVTIIHKANIFKKTGGLFLETGQHIGRIYADIIETDDMIVDNTAQKLVLDPTRFDVLACNNEHGDILSDLCAGLVGGLGLAPGANIGDQIAIFEAVHGTAPDIAGKGIANPTAVILSAAMMLDHIGEAKAANIIRWAVAAVINNGIRVTRDLNPQNGVSTKEMTDAIIEKIQFLHDHAAEQCC